jgi:hypothetical protein
MYLVIIFNKNGNVDIIQRFIFQATNSSHNIISHVLSTVKNNQFDEVFEIKDLEK